MKLIWRVLVLILVLIYEKVWRPMVCKKKIYHHIENIGGQVGNIEKLTPRDEVYSVYYIVNGQSKHSNVKFNLFYKSTWK
ncbi:hypothetical protein [Anaerophilus nitritogenes]|uniref:hypothetical protein n=1 Tax=Anaerophilus nitritogenes TaxID=2498136 RepID=UPI00101C034F|nr:hypothetical protein [Anaerophilus nitritogenes]